MSFKKYLAENQSNPLDEFYITDLLNVTGTTCNTTFFASWVFDQVPDHVNTTILATYDIEQIDNSMHIEFQGNKTTHDEVFPEIRNLSISVSIDDAENLSLMQNSKLLDLIQTKLNFICKSKAFTDKVLHKLNSNLTEITQKYVDYMQ